MKTLTILFWIAAALPAGPPQGFEHWTAGALRAYQKSLSAGMNQQKLAARTLVGYGNHSFLVAHREASGEAELHQSQNDVMVVETGQATLVVGGTVVDPKTTAPGEIRGPSIQGGENVPLAPGDVVHIPNRVPHQMLLAPGKQITYFVVKIDAR